MERKLAAILAADMVGYSARMGADEVGTLRRLQLARIQVVEPEIAAHNGRLFKVMGDGFLAEFPSAIDALSCSGGIQRAQRRANADRSEVERVDFRIGLNFGDVLVEEGDVYGDTVNIAARLETLAPEGGIVVPEDMRNHLQGKSATVFEYMGPQRLRNVPDPVVAFRVATDVEEGALSSETAALGTALNRQPVLAILPFDNRSGASDDMHLADGITEDLITTLSQIGHLTVISRNSAFTYRGREVSARQVGRDLNADYMLSGSVRQSGDKLRITAQLVDTTTEALVWSERVDRGMEDIFAVQDDITLTIANSLQVELAEGEQAKLRYTTTDNVEAWIAFTRGVSHFRTVSADTYRQARAAFEQALSHDQNAAQIHAMLAYTHAIEGRFFWTEDRERTLDLAKSHADKALALDADCSDAYAALGYWHMCYQRLDESCDAYGRAVSLAPDHADIRALYALALTFAERADEAVREAQIAIRLNPLDPGWYQGVLGHAYRYAGRVDDAIAVLTDYNWRSPGFGLVDLVLAHADEERMDLAKVRARELLAARPGFTIENWSLTQNVKLTARLERDRRSLEEAGLPIGEAS